MIGEFRDHDAVGLAGLVASGETNPKELLEAAIAVDRADIPATTVRRLLAEAVPRTRPRPRVQIPEWFDELRATAEGKRRAAQQALDEAAVTPITAGSAPFTGTFQPEGSLAAFNDLDAAGTWMLEIRDNVKGDSGTLNSWSITIDE